jgi:hypothetical protein
MSLSIIQSALVTKWNETIGLEDSGSGSNPIPLQFGRNDEGTTYPRAVLHLISDLPQDAFDASLEMDIWVYQFSILDSDKINDPEYDAGTVVANLVEVIRNTYQRVKLTLSSGALLAGLKIDSGFMIEDQEDPNSQNVYHGWIRFKFTVTNQG